MKEILLTRGCTFVLIFLLGVITSSGADDEIADPWCRALNASPNLAGEFQALNLNEGAGEAGPVQVLTPDWVPGTLLPHVFDAHHHQEMGEWIPDFSAIATRRVNQSGRWSELFAGVTLGQGDVVLIPEGVSVTYDALSDSGFRALVVLGALRFDPEQSARLVVETLFVAKAGSLTIQPARFEVMSEVVFSGRLNVREDPMQIGLGLFTSGGRIEVQGTLGRTPISLTRSARAGSRTITVDAVGGWRVGDVIVFPDLQTGTNPGYWNFPAVYAGQTERIAVAAINGNQVTLERPLAHDHVAGGFAFIGNVTRNVVFRSDVAGGGDRAHLLFGGHAYVRFNYALVADMGRTTTEVRDDTEMDSSGRPTHVGQNQRARYALHAHHVHEAVTFHGNVILGMDTPWGSERFGIVLHDSRGDIRSNIVIGARGSGIFFEDGVETGDAVGNLVIGTGGGTGRGDELRFGDYRGEDMGSGGFGIWARGTLVKIRFNVAAGYFSQAAYAYFTHNNFVSGIVPNIPGNPAALVNQKIKLSQMPIQTYGAFEGNLAHGIYRHAFEMTYQQVSGGTLLKDFSAIMLGKDSMGLFLGHCFRVALQNPNIIGAGGGIGLINNSGQETSVDISAGRFTNLDVAIMTTPKGGKILNTIFSTKRYNVEVDGGVGLIYLYNYLGTGKDYRVYRYSNQAPGPTVTLPGVLGVGLPLN